MIYGTGLIHRLCGVTRLHAVAHANTINHGEYELGTRMGPFETGRTSRANVCSFSRTSRLSCIRWSMILQWQSLLAVNRCNVVLQLESEESIWWARSTSYVGSISKAQHQLNAITFPWRIDNITNFCAMTTSVFILHCRINWILITKFSCIFLLSFTQIFYFTK